MTSHGAGLWWDFLPQNVGLSSGSLAGECPVGPFLYVGDSGVIASFHDMGCLEDIFYFLLAPLQGAHMWRETGAGVVAAWEMACHPGCHQANLLSPILRSLSSSLEV